MNELIKTSNNENGDIIVSGRELHEFLEVDSKYLDWINRMIEYGFTENIDYIAINELTPKKEGSRIVNRKLVNHHLKIETAKEISMIQRNEKGKQARQYFLHLEKLWNSPEMVMKRAMDFLNKQIDEMRVRIDQDKPKVFLANALEVSVNCILIKDLATLLKQNGIDIGQNRLFTWLRDNEYLCTHKSMKNKPTQRAMDLELFELSTTLITSNSGETLTKFTPKVTGKGQLYFINKFLADQQ